MLNRLLYIFSFCLIVNVLEAQVADPVLMKVGQSNVTVSEFKYIYEKNNGTNADYSRKSVMEYLDLYTKFKLKVEKAKSLQLDTISSLRSELEGYRKQLAGSYLIDKEVTEALLKELYDRMDYDIEFSHIFVAAPENASAKQKEIAKAKLRDVKAKLVGGMDFGAAAAAYSEDNSTAPRGGKMSFITAKLPSGFYELETALYTTPVGQTSDIIESKMGFHIIKVTNKRPARGLIEVAQILIDSSNKDLADSIAQRARNGENFESLVAKYSIDKLTAKNGGKLAPFGINTYNLSFEIASFTLHKDGDVSLPTLTEAGWHIVKRLQRLPKDPYDLFVRKMKAQINKDSRFDIAKLNLIKDIKKSAGIKEDTNELNKFVATLGDDFYSYKWIPASSISENPLFTIGGDHVYTTKDFADYCKKSTRIRLKYEKSKPLKETVDELYNNYVNDLTLAYEEQSLDKKYIDFRFLMREYEEGILLFEVTKLNVWDKANQDTVGLISFYQSVADKYVTNEKALVSEVVVHTTDRKLAEKVYKFATKNNVDDLEKKFNKKNKVVTYTKNEYDKGSKELADIVWKKNSKGTLNSSSDGGIFTFLKINDLIPSRPKSLGEARGYVVADYQNYLDKEWVKSLDHEYNIVIYKDVLNSLIK